MEDDNAGKVPQQIADKLRGSEFKNWDEFRRSFWKEVAEDPVLSKGFSQQDIQAMKVIGKAPSWKIRCITYIFQHELICQI